MLRQFQGLVPRIQLQLLGCRNYAHKGQRLSKSVAQPGKGKTVVARSSKKLAARRAASFKPLKERAPTQATTLDMGEFAKLSGVSPEERKLHRNVLEKVDDFEQLRIDNNVRQALLDNLPEGATPTPVQKVAVKSLRSRRHNPLAFRTWLLAAETGSGKTAAYLAPLLSDLIESKTSEEPPSDEAGDVVRRRSPTIRGIVLVPTLELVDQVAAFSSAVAKTCGLKVVAAGQQRVSKVTKSVVAGCDLLVTTPDKIRQLADIEPVLCERALSECKFVVVDEADSLMNESFSESTLSAIKRCPQLTDLLFVTATIPRHFDKVLRTEFPETTRLVTPSIHRLPRHIEFRVIEVFRPPYRDNKHLALQQALYSIYHDRAEPGLQKRVVVFVNKKQEVQPLVAMLKNAGYPAFGLDGSLKSNERQELLQDFVEPPKDSVGNDPQEKLKVLVATDLVARGIDMHKVRNIILYDLPYSSADLLHRAGRTGRLGSKGRVLLFVSKKESQGWVKGLETIVKRGQALA